jgi:hypothetical protein
MHSSDPIVRSTLAVIDFRLAHRHCLPPPAALAEFRSALAADLDEAFLLVPPDLRFRLGPFLQAIDRLPEILTETRNPRMALDQLLDSLQECMVLLYHARENRARLPALAA